MGPPKVEAPKAVEQAPAPPTIEDGAAQARRELERARKRRGFAASIVSERRGAASGSSVGIRRILGQG